jgi:hypothetical protein
VKDGRCRALQDLYEEAILTPSLSQGLAILWAEEMEERERDGQRVASEEDEELLPELDGHLTFGKKTRRR